jgi:hypothetical protein
MHILQYARPISPFRQQRHRIPPRDGRAFRTSIRGAPAPARKIRRERCIQRRPIHTRLTTRNDSRKSHRNAPQLGRRLPF